MLFIDIDDIVHILKFNFIRIYYFRIINYNSAIRMTYYKI